MERGQSLERETTAGSSASFPSTAFPDSAAKAAHPATAITARAVAAARAVASAATEGLQRCALRAKRLVCSSQLQGWLLLLLLLEQPLLMGLLLQRQQLQLQQRETEQQALSLQRAFQEQQHRLLGSRRSRIGVKQQQEQQQCRCKPCSRLRLSEEFIDLTDRFRHTKKEIDAGVAALLRCIDTAAAGVSNIYEEALKLPWKKRLDIKLEELEDQQ